jgi:SPP1 family predicted phage head-tail adaptor
MGNIGKRRHRITIQRLVEGSPAQDAGGTPDEAWATFSTDWARIRPLEGRELERAQAVHAEVTGRIEIRYRAGVTARMRALFGSRPLEILAVINVEERNRDMHLLYKEGPSVG